MNRNKAARVLLGILAGLFAALILASVFVTLNLTPSFPLGVYKNLYRVSQKGDLVSFCLPAGEMAREAKARGYIGAGLCKGGHGMLIKKIFAWEGDHVAFTPEGVYVNDVLIPNTAPLRKDAGGRLMPRASGSCVLSPGHLLLLSDYNPLSFDARYFGILDSPTIIHPLEPILTWDAR